MIVRCLVGTSGPLAPVCDCKSSILVCRLGLRRSTNGLLPFSFLAGDDRTWERRESIVGSGVAATMAVMRFAPIIKAEGFRQKHLQKVRESSCRAAPSQGIPPR